MRSRRGSFVAIVGPDGVGKTTLAKHLLELAPEPKGYVHFRPRILESLPSRPGSLTMVSLDKQPPKNRFLGWLRLGVSVPRFWLGYLTAVVPLLRRGGTVVADRWAYGYVAQPEALRFFGPPSLARLAIRIIPRPDLVINLSASPKLIASRKAELSEEAIGEELDLWESLPVEPIRTMDASLPPDDLAARTLAELESLPRPQSDRGRGTVSDLKISVVTPSYNQGPFLEQTLRSVQDQAYPRVEHIVIDGGSSDESMEILERWSDRLAYWVSEPDAGQTDALIKGFGHATGDILCWLNSDDMFEPSTLQQVARFFEAHPRAQVVFGDATWVDAEGRFLHPKREHPFSRFIFMYDHDFVPQPSTFWRRELYVRVGGLNPAFDLAMDADLFIRFADVTRIHHVRRPWSRMRLYPEQKNQRLRLRSNFEDGLIRDRYFESQPRWVIRSKRAAARGMRIVWKLMTGCYTRADVNWWMSRVFGREL